MKFAYLLPAMLVSLMSSCDKPAASVGDARPADNESSQQKTDVKPAQKTKEASAKDNPLVERAHLPLPERLVGLRFISNEPAEKGYAPGPMADGFYFLDFGLGWLTWTHADVEDAYEFKMDEMGVFVATRQKELIEGHFNNATGALTWNGKSYRIYLEPPRKPRADDHSPPALTKIPGGLKLNLASTRLESKTVGVGLGSLNVTTLGHHDGYFVFDYIPECEGGFSVFRHRLPIKEKTATIKVDGEVRVTASFDTAKSKRVHIGNMLMGGPVMFRGWAQKSSSGKVYTSIQNLIDGDGAVAEVGKTAKVRCMFYTDDKYVNLDDQVKQHREITLTISNGDESSFLDVAVQGMKEGGWRRAKGLATAATRLRDGNEAIEQGKMIFVELNMISVQ
jgi:hypothetical protein